MGWFFNFNRDKLSKEEKKEAVEDEMRRRTAAGRMLGGTEQLGQKLFYAGAGEDYDRARPVSKWEAVLSLLLLPLNLVQLGKSLLGLRNANPLDAIDGVGLGVPAVLDGLETEAKYKEQQNQPSFLRRIFYKPSQGQAKVDKRSRASQQAPDEGGTLDGARNQKNYDYQQRLNEYTPSYSPSRQRSGPAQFLNERESAPTR